MINAAVGIQMTPLKVSDRCDGSECPAQALVRVALLAGDLDYCGHHYAKYEKALSELAVGILDIRDTLSITSCAN